MPLYSNSTFEFSLGWVQLVRLRLFASVVLRWIRAVRRGFDLDITGWARSDLIGYYTTVRFNSQTQRITLFWQYETLKVSALTRTAREICSHVPSCTVLEILRDMSISCLLNVCFQPKRWYAYIFSPQERKFAQNLPRSVSNKTIIPKNVWLRGV